MESLPSCSFPSLSNCLFYQESITVCSWLPAEADVHWVFGDKNRLGCRTGRYGADESGRRCWGASASDARRLRDRLLGWANCKFKMSAHKCFIRLLISMPNSHPTWKKLFPLEIRWMPIKPGGSLWCRRVSAPTVHKSCTQKPRPTCDFELAL